MVDLAGGFAGLDLNGLDEDVLKGELVAGLGEEAEGDLAGFVDGAELDFDAFAAELRERLVHFPIEDERGVGVQLFLELVDLLFPAVPRPRFVHCKHKHIAARVVGKCIEHAGMSEPHRAGGQAFVGNHWYNMK